MTAEQVEALERKLERQRRLVEASYALHTSLDLDEVLALILVAATRGVGADRGTVFLLSEDRKELWSRVLQADEHIDIRLPLGRGIAGTVGQTGEIVRIPDAYEDDRFDRSWDEKTGYRTRQILCAPIRNREREIVGVFQLLNKQEGDFTEEDEAFLEELSIHASLAVENARLHASALEQERQEREIRLALDVQRQFQPERRERREGSIVLAGMNELCEDATGDYYDFLDQLPGGRIGVAVGDVSGHGLQAALVMAEARAYLRAFVRATADVARAMSLLNHFLVPDMMAGKFLTLFSAVVETRTGKVDWCNGGHCPPLHLSAESGEIRYLKGPGTVLGIFRDSSYQPGKPFYLAPGDVLLLYTDGATEARNREKEQFGEARLATILREEAANGPAAILDRIRDAVQAWSASEANEDDLTLVAVKREE